jgi:hypothetical protein
MLDLHRTTASIFRRRGARAPAGNRPAHHRRRRAWGVEYLEGRTLLSHFEVINLNDSGAGSLRQAIVDSNKTTGPNEIDFSAGLRGTITLTSGELLLANNDVKIVGPGQDVLSVSGNGSSRVFEIASRVTASLSGLTITGGNADNGGGIYNAGSLTVVNSTIAHNWGNYESGGIYNAGSLTVTDSTFAENVGFVGGIGNDGTVTITDSTFFGNSGYIHGGGIANGGTLTLSNSTFVSNVAAHGNGGGIDNTGTLTVSNSTFAQNETGSDGGGIANSGSLTITNSTFAQNNASEIRFRGYGGGIANDGTVTITNSTFAQNTAAHGGGIVNSEGTVTINASTISGNKAETLSGDGTGGGVFNTGTVTINNSIISGNIAVNYTGFGGGPDGWGGFDSLGHNLIGNTEGSSGWVETDLHDVDPMLGPLQDNGGPTMTMALLPGSPAIDSGSNALIPPGVQYDQRGPGFLRIVNATGKPTAIVDIGAFEWQPYVSSFVASWGSQAAPLKAAADGLRLLPASRKTDLPWLDIKTLTISISTAEALTPDDLTVTSARGTDYGATLSGSGTSYTITLKTPITQADRVTIQLNLGGLVAPTFELDVLPGDVNDDGIVNAQDMVLIRNAIQKPSDPLMIGWFDVDGSGKVDTLDYTAARNKLGSRLP